MPIIETLYQLTESDTTNVNGLWKGLQIIGYALASFTAFIASTSFYIILNGFSWNCILYTDVEFRKLSPDDSKYKIMVSNGTNVTIDYLSTIWNHDVACQYCILIWTISFVAGIILGAFFILNPRGGKGLPDSLFTQPWKMVVPVLLVSILMAILTTIANINAVGGINSFCASFVNHTGKSSCSKKIDVYTLKFHNKMQPINKLQRLVKTGSAMTFIAWICCVILLLVRLCLAPDFNIQLINMVPSERRFPEKKKVYSKPSYTDFPLFPVATIQELPIETDKDFKENDSKEENPTSSNQASHTNKSTNNTLSLLNKDDYINKVASPKNKDNNSAQPGYSKSTKTNSKPSYTVLPVLPVDKIEELPIETHKDFEENNIQNKELANSDQFNGADKSNDNVHSPLNNEDDSAPASSNNNDNNPSLRGNNNSTAENIKKVFFKML